MWPFTGSLVRGTTARLAEQGIEIDEDATLAGYDCINARLGRTEKVERFTSALMDYDIPLGQSPATQSDSLLKLLETGKKMCLAPLATGALAGTGQLTQGQYIAALLSTATGGVMTLILLGTIAVGSILIYRVAQRRDRTHDQ